MNYYDILGVNKNSTQKQIRESYKNLVKKYHPDLYRGDKSFAEKKTKEINVAYDVLSDPQKRAEYDEEISPKTTYTDIHNTPNYSSNHNNQKYEDFKQKYNRYNYDTSRAYKDGSEHDYSTYANYENINKTYNYKYSQYASSNYTNRKNPQTEFYDKILKKFDSFTFKTKKRMVIILILIYIIFVIITMKDFIYMFDFDKKTNNSFKNPTNNIINTIQQNSVNSDLSNNTKSNNSTKNQNITNNQIIHIPNQNSISNENGIDNKITDTPNNNNLNINDIYSEEELEQIYKSYFEKGNTFDNYDEFKNTLEYYLQTYMYYN